MRVQRCKGSMRRVWVSAWGLFIGGGSACCTDAPALKGARPKASWGFVENKRGFIANNFRPSNMSAGLITLDIAYTAYMSRMAARQLYIYE